MGHVATGLPQKQTAFLLRFKRNTTA